VVLPLDREDVAGDVLAGQLVGAVTAVKIDRPRVLPTRVRRSVDCRV
jgi:hypothetical protein